MSHIDTKMKERFIHSNSNKNATILAHNLKQREKGLWKAEREST
jgi:hypothetical protein